MQQLGGTALYNLGKFQIFYSFGKRMRNTNGFFNSHPYYLSPDMDIYFYSKLF